jgi:hypothetical protein
MSDSSSVSASSAAAILRAVARLLVPGVITSSPSTIFGIAFLNIFMTIPFFLPQAQNYDEWS